MHWDNEDLKVQGLPLKARKEPGSVFHVQWGVLALQVCSMHSLILLWVEGTKGEKVSVHVGGDGD